MEKIKVIHFVDRLKRGGTQAVLYEWAQNVDKNRFQFDFLTFLDSDEKYVEEFKGFGCNVYQISKLSFRNIKAFRKDLDVFFSTHKYDIAHGHSKSKNAFFLYAAKKNGINVRISHSHSSKFQSRALWGNLLKPFMKSVSTDYFACSKEAAEFLFGKNSVAKGNIVIIPNGVNTNKFAFNIHKRMEMRKKLNISDNQIVIGHVGRFMLPKNHLFLIDIFNEIHSINSDTVLMLIGDGEEARKKAVEEKISEYGIQDSVLLLGARKDVFNLMQAMDIFVLPSLYEGLPVVGVEAQSSGLPCVFSDIITREVNLLPTTHYLSLKQSPVSWAEMILSSVVKEDDRYGKDIIVKDAGFDSETVIENLMAIYKNRLSVE